MTHKEILELISAGNTREAIQALLQSSLQKDQDTYKEIVLQAARFEDYKKVERSGTESRESLDIRLSRINHALIEVAGQLPGSTSAVQMTHTYTESKSFYKRYLPLVSLIFALIAIGIGWIVWKQLNGKKMNGSSEKVRLDDRPITNEESYKPDTPHVSYEPVTGEQTATSKFRENKTDPPPEVTTTQPQSQIQPIEPEYDHFKVIVNSTKTKIFIDDVPAIIVSGGNLQVKEIKVPKSAKKIKLVLPDNSVCSELLQNLNSTINQNEICH